jgi:monovalent cation/hydrogen antiporter
VVLQGLSLPWLIRVLGLSTVDESYCEEGQARQLMLQAAIDFLRERRNSAAGDSETHLFDDLLHQFEHKFTAIELCGPDGSAASQDTSSLTASQLLLETVRREREELNLLRERGRIGDGVHRNLERELDLSESRLT